MATRTESRSDTTEPIDLLEPKEAAKRLVDAQCAAAAVVKPVAPLLSEAAKLMADAISSGGRIFFCGAGSSGLMAMADALELPGTYGIDPEQVFTLLAGGRDNLHYLAGIVEDNETGGYSELTDMAPSARDCVIVVSASGATPYALGVARAASAASARIIALANNDGAPLLDYADVAIVLDTAAETVAGSTRLGAGTAQKIALNTMSTLCGVLLGHVHDGMMVNLRAENHKLRDRAAHIVSEITGIDGNSANAALQSAGGDVKKAVLIASGLAASDASRLLDETGQNLRKALSRLERA